MRKRSLPEEPWEEVNREAAAMATRPREQAPTLLSGEGASSNQDSVRVWAPDTRTLAREVRANSFWFCVDIALSAALMWPLGFNERVFPAWSAWRRPRYIATDAAGIAITRRRGTVALKWTEIQSFREGQNSLINLLYAPEKVELNLYGYQDPTRYELCAFIVSKAGLQPDEGDPFLFVRPV